MKRGAKKYSLFNIILFVFVGTYSAQSDFEPDIVGRVSTAARSLCLWVLAMETYGHIFREVEPKKQRLANATSQLEEKQAILAEAKAKLKEVKFSHSFDKILAKYE